MSKDKDEVSGNDHRGRRCPMLGHAVQFSYCRTTDSDTICRKIFDCWWDTFDVIEFVREQYGEGIIGQILAPPKDKVASLVDLINKARDRKD